MERLRKAKAVIRRGRGPHKIHSTNTSTRGNPLRNQASQNSHLMIMQNTSAEVTDNDTSVNRSSEDKFTPQSHHLYSMEFTYLQMDKSTIDNE